MSRLDDLKEQLTATAQNLGQKIQESATYVQWQDRYQTLSPSAQKLTKLLGALFLVLILIFYPMSLYFSSQEAIQAYEEKRNLIRDLFKTYRESSTRPNISMPPPIDSLRSSIQGTLASANLTPEQIIGISEAAVEGKLIDPKLVSHALEVRLGRLNLNQIVEIGSSLVGISDSVKMKDMDITTNLTDTRYFDVNFKLYSLNVPEPTPEPPPEVETKPKKGSSKKDDSESKDNP